MVLDGDKEDWQDDNIKYTYRASTEYVSLFFESAYRISTAPWIFMGNDDIEILTKGWDTIPDLSDPWRLFHFDDQQFRHTFGCHPLTSRKIWEIIDKKGLVFPPFKNMGCDTTLWDTVPAERRIYVPRIVINHDRLYDEKKRAEMAEDYKYYDSFDGIRQEAKREIYLESGMKEPRVLIGLSTGEHIRKADFLPYFMGLEKPPNTLLTTVHGQSPAQARNIIIKQALAGDCTHIFFTDDDMALPPDTIMKLIKHDKDIVMGLYLMRSFPHFPCAFDLELANGYNKFMYLTPDVNGLIEITNGGLGCVLMNTDVFRGMEEPWVTLGELQKDGWCDDVSFYNRARKAGFHIFLDTNCCVGHMMSVNIWPEKSPTGEWYTAYKHLNGNVLFPQTIPTEEQTKDELEKHATT